MTEDEYGTVSNDSCFLLLFSLSRRDIATYFGSTAADVRKCTGDSTLDRGRAQSPAAHVVRTTRGHREMPRYARKSNA